jgi:hypothetical protein
MLGCSSGERCSEGAHGFARRLLVFSVEHATRTGHLPIRSLGCPRSCLAYLKVLHSILTVRCGRRWVLTRREQH